MVAFRARLAMLDVPGYEEVCVLSDAYLLQKLQYTSFSDRY